MRLGLGLLSFVVLLSFPSAADDEPRLFRSEGVRCCRPGQGPDRCLRILTRSSDPDDIAAACASVLGTSGAADPNRSSRSGCRQAQSNGDLFGIESRHYRREGWWLDGPPDWTYEGNTYPADQLAVSSPGCSTLRIGSDAVAGWEAERERCRTRGYQPVHLYVSLSDDFMDTYTGHVVDDDPWSDDDDTENRVIRARATRWSDLQRTLHDLLADCKVVQHAMFVGHGNEGIVATRKDGRGDEVLSLEDFFRDVATPCAFTPGARIQMTGCDQACGAGGRNFSDQMARVFGSSTFHTPRYQTLEGVQVLLNTSTTWFENPSGWEELWGERARHYPVNGLGVVYTLRDSTVAQDVRDEDIPACGASKKLH